MLSAHVQTHTAFETGDLETVQNTVDCQKLSRKAKSDTKEQSTGE